jgi:hypothetical protein
MYPYPIPMADFQDPAPNNAPPTGGQPRRSPLRRILDEHPEARPRVGRAVAALLGTLVVAVAMLGALLIWHLVRRGRLIRERLNPPRVVPPLELPSQEVDQSQ